VAEAAATGIAGIPRIRVEAVVLLVVGAHNWNKSLVLSPRSLWPVLCLSLLVSDSSIVETQCDSRWAILQRLDPEGLWGQVSIERNGSAVESSHMSPKFISSVAVGGFQNLRQKPRGLHGSPCLKYITSTSVLEKVHNKLGVEFWGKFKCQRAGLEIERPGTGKCRGFLQST
jgi:hypothetical protein